MSQPRTRQRRLRPDELTDQQLLERWRTFRAMALKYMLLSGGVMVAAFLVSHVIAFSGGTAKLVKGAFQIGLGGTVLFAFMFFMAILFTSGWNRGQPK